MDIIVAACKKNNGIGFEGKLPWRLKNEMQYFRDITTHCPEDMINIVIMGRNTWFSIPEQHRPLKKRINIVISSTVTIKEPYTFVFKTLAEAYIFAARYKNHKKIFIIGGERLYREAIKHGHCNNIYITEIYQNYECDTFFPDIKSEYSITNVSKFKEENGVHYRHLIYTNNKALQITKTDLEFIEETPIWINKEEEQYINTLKKILTYGEETDDRTGVGTLSTFGERFKYDLRETFPLLTTKRMFVRAIFEELMLYISGKTDNKILQEKKIHIWDGNTTREFLDKRGLTSYPEGDMGETYGFNFRHYGAEYKGCDKDYTGQGFDQIENVVNLIKTNPKSRRILINLFNPATQHKAALPACLCQYQFHVNLKRKELNLQIYLRSSDFFLANNWNAITGAFLVHMICNLKGVELTPGDLTVITGDTHIYKNHVDGVKENIKRTPQPYPKLVVNIPEKKESLRDFKYEDMKIVGYYPMPNIKVDMAV